MERPACGTLPPLPPRRILENVRDQFAALRGSGPPARLLVNFRPHDDQRDHLEGAVGHERGRAPDQHFRILDVGTVAADDGRSAVSVWLVAPPATQDALPRVCSAAGVRLRQLLVDHRLVDEKMSQPGLLWPFALARKYASVFRLACVGDENILVPEAGVPSDGPLAGLHAQLAGAEFTPDRLFVIEDVVETSIVLVDRLIEGLPPDKPTKPKDETAGKRPKVPRKRGRPSMEGLDRVAKAVFWYDQALKSHDEDLRRALAGGDDSPAAVYAALTEYPLELDRKSVDRKHLALFPEKAGEKVAAWSFRDYAIDIDKSSFVRYMGEHKKRTRGQASAMPARTVAAEKGEAGKKDTAATIRQQALERANDALFKVTQKKADESRWAALTKAMTKAGVDDDVAKELLASRDDAALTAAGKRIADLMA